MDKYNDLYEWWSCYNRRLFLRFIAFVAALFFFNEREWGLFVANASDSATLGGNNYLIEQDLWKKWMIDSPVVDVID